MLSSRYSLYFCPDPRWLWVLIREVAIWLSMGNGEPLGYKSRISACLFYAYYTDLHTYIFYRLTHIHLIQTYTYTYYRDIHSFHDKQTYTHILIYTDLHTYILYRLTYILYIHTHLHIIQIYIHKYKDYMHIIQTYAYTCFTDVRTHVLYRLKLTGTYICYCADLLSYLLYRLIHI